MVTAEQKAWFRSEEFRSQIFYQGCKGKLDEEHLEHFERTGEYIAEPKRDGIWAIAFGDEDGIEFRSRPGLIKEYSLSKVTALAGIALVGELAYGSQESRRRRAEYGYDFMDVWTAVAINYDASLMLAYGEVRRRTLVSILRSLPLEIRKHFKLIPRWRKNFRMHYQAEREGLILKHRESDREYLGDGKKVKYWLKCKKEFEEDVVVMDWEPSTAKTRIIEDEQYVEHLICGMYVDGELKELAEVGGFKHALSKKIAANFEQYRGRVLRIQHSAQFKSGRFRHPRPHKEYADPFRDDKLPEDCIFFR